MDMVIMLHMGLGGTLQRSYELALNTLCSSKIYYLLPVCRKRRQHKSRLTKYDQYRVHNVFFGHSKGPFPSLRSWTQHTGQQNNGCHLHNSRECQTMCPFSQTWPVFLEFLCVDCWCEFPCPFCLKLKFANACHFLIQKQSWRRHGFQFLMDKRLDSWDTTSKHTGLTAGVKDYFDIIIFQGVGFQGRVYAGESHETK